MGTTSLTAIRAPLGLVITFTVFLDWRFANFGKAILSVCGITGVAWNRQQGAVDRSTLERMTERLSHRGPDAQDTYWEPYVAPAAQQTLSQAGGTDAGTHKGVGLGFRRLSIIDLATGMQPISNEDDSIRLIFNGEIYNFQELRKRLEGNGHRFKTQGDAETILHLYEDEGEECFKRLRGMFAIAIWDRNLRRLLIARDRLGQKPLFYTITTERFAFASELKSLLELPGISTDINLNAIDQYLLYQYIPHPQTIYQHIASLAPGTFGVWSLDSGQFRSAAYWSLPTATTRLSKAEAMAKLKGTLSEAVGLRMQSEVPLGAFLSGGVDSSLIAALMQQKSSEPIQTFSIGFREAEYDETRFAKSVSKHLGTKHESYIVQPDAVSIFPEFIEQYDQPFADSSALPTWYLSQMTRQQVTVALSGDGSDELFGGYPRYQAAAMADRLDRIPGAQTALGWHGWQRLPSNMSQRNILRRWKRFCDAMTLPPLNRYMQWIGIFHDGQRAQLYSDAMLSHLGEQDPLSFLQPLFQATKSRDAVNRFSLMDLQSYLPCDLNTKVDMASMKHSLEVRQPFLDHHVVELAASLPGTWKIAAGKGKRILRETFAALLPREIWTRRKQGFGVPLDHWFRGPLAALTKETLLSEAALSRGLFEKAYVQELVEQHISGQFDHAYRLWSLLVLELWFQRWKPDFQL